MAYFISDTVSSPFGPQYGVPVKAHLLIKTNIDALLRARGETRKALAQWCHRSESWISKAFRDPNRSIPLRYLDRISDFFGVETHQLFQPGLSANTERRQRDRRTGRERRVGPAVRLIREIAPGIHARERLQSTHVLEPSEEALIATYRNLDATARARLIAALGHVKESRPKRGKNSVS